MENINQSLEYKLSVVNTKQRQAISKRHNGIKGTYEKSHPTTEYYYCNLSKQYNRQIENEYSINHTATLNELSINDIVQRLENGERINLEEINNNGIVVNDRERF